VVSANGNAFTGGLSFAPAKVSVPVGGSVAWHNTDFIAPHTATENHGLWDYGGIYGQTPINGAGFAPGVTVTRQFEAGTQLYYCKVHPVQMHGEVDVPVTLALTSSKQRVRVKVKVKRAHGRHKAVYRYKRVLRSVEYVEATWAPGTKLASGRVMDVQVRSGSGAWKPFLTGTPTTSGQFKAGKKGTVWEVQARLRGAPGAETGWSPAAKITG
jgi:plastocyanin